MTPSPWPTPQIREQNRSLIWVPSAPSTTPSARWSGSSSPDTLGVSSSSCMKPAHAGTGSSVCSQAGTILASWYQSHSFPKNTGSRSKPTNGTACSWLSCCATVISTPSMCRSRRTRPFATSPGPGNRHAGSQECQESAQGLPVEARYPVYRHRQLVGGAHPLAFGSGHTHTGAELPERPSRYLILN